MYSLRVKDNYKKLYISKEHPKANVGIDSPGVGKYYSGTYPKRNTSSKIPKGRKSEFNYDIDNGVPGPIYSTQTIEDIGSPKRIQLAVI